MREVIGNKGENDQSAHYHVTRSDGCLHVAFSFVMHRTCAAILDRQTDRVENVLEHGHKKKDPDGPEQGTESTQMLRVAVYPIRSEEHPQLSKQVSDNKHEQNKAGPGHNHS